MLYKVGDKVICEVESPKEGMKRILIREPSKGSKISEKEFVIVYIDKVIEAYTIIIDDDMVGWNISKWHVEHWRVPAKYIGRKFYDVTEAVIKGKK